MIELAVLDAKAVAGTLATGAAASTTWLDVAEPIVTIVMTLVVGLTTLWYTWERAKDLRNKRKRREALGDDG